MIDPIIQFFEKLITQFSWRRLFFILIVVFISIGLLAWYETYTGHFRLNKIDNEIKLLAQLTTLSKAIKEENNDKLTSIFKGITQDLEMQINYSYPVFNIHPTLLKAMAAAFPWAFMLLLFVLTGNTPKETYFGTIALAAPFIIIGAFLPNYVATWLNYLIYPIGHFTIIIIVVLLLQKRKAKL
jgi:hypothetical protein